MIPPDSPRSSRSAERRPPRRPPRPPERFNDASQHREVTRQNAIERAHRVLELAKVLSRLQELAASEPGRELVRQLTPRADVALARRAQTETGEARRFLQTGKTLAFGGVRDIRPALQRAAIGSVLDVRDLLHVWRLAESARRIRQSILSAEDRDWARPDWDQSTLEASPTAPGAIVIGHAELIVPHPELEKQIADAIDEASEDIKDTASVDLLKARRNIRQTQATIQARLRSMLSDTNIQPALQENFVTVRDGRYCLPVKSEARSRVPGIVHDRSGGGSTVFIEPQVVIDLNNRLRELQLEEREAIDAILRELSAAVALVRDDLETALESCALLDFAFAKGRMSLEQDAVEPRIEDAEAPPKYFLRAARHPLIEKPVANDIRLGDDFDVLMVTGPNTGGKTVVMKTLGLLVLMAMCGLHVPAAPQSTLHLPGAMYADIGDEQSIEQSLSTFSSHLTNIIAILDNARPGDLVFLDEIGAGTDPDEGAALAKAILRALQRKGAQVISTTHYGELKHFSASALRFENASVEFDAQSLSPTYRLRIGIPGASNALEIAARLGMAPELTQRARRYLGTDRQEAEAATQRLEETQRELQQQTSGAEREREAAEKLRRDYERKLERLQSEMEKEREQARREAMQLVEQTQREADEVLRTLRGAAQGAARENKETEAARGRLRSLRGRVQDATRTPNKRADADQSTLTAREQARPRELAAPRLDLPKNGDLVRIKSLGREGVLLSEMSGESRVAVRIGAIKIDVRTSDIETISSRPPAVNIGLSVRKSLEVPDEINIIGKTTDQALPELEKYLDDALLSDAKQLRIVHGRGSGALRSFVHRWLRDQRSVREFALAPLNEGGEGATIVILG